MSGFEKNISMEKADLIQFETPQGKVSLWSIFLPFFAEMLLMNMVGTVNTLTLSRYSDEAVAAVGAANQLMMMVFTFYAIVSGGASVVINHKLGAKDFDEASQTARTSLLLSGCISLVLGTVMAINAEKLMDFLNLEGNVRNQGILYFRTCIKFSFLQAFISGISAIFRSYGLPRIAVIVSLLMNVLNALLCILIIFRPFEVPLYGVEGIARANVISRVTALAVILILLIKGPINLEQGGRFSLSPKRIKGILAIGVPGGFSNISYTLSQVVSTSILAILGTAALTTKIYLSTIFFYVYVTGLALGQSTALIVGWLAGAGEHERAYALNRRHLKIAVILNGCLSSLIFLFGKGLIGLFTDDPEIISMAKVIMAIDILVEIGRAFNHIEASSLTGAGDVRFSMIISIASCWMMSILLSYVLGIRLGLGLPGCWAAFMMDEFFRGIALDWRFRSKKWYGKGV